MIPSPARPSLLFVGVCVLLVGLLGACGGDTNRNAKVVEPRLVQTPDGQRVFAGTLVNQGASTIGIAEVEVALYDDQGARIETMRIQVRTSHRRTQSSSIRPSTRTGPSSRRRCGRS